MRTFTSATESMDGILCTLPLEPVSRLVTPSIVMFFESLRPPRIKMLPILVGPGASRPSLVSTTPAIKLTASNMSRPRNAI